MLNNNENSKKNLFEINLDNNIFGSVTSMNDSHSPFIDPINVRDGKCAKSINDLDSSLILENIDKKATNKAVKIDLKIMTLEKNLANINEQLELLLLLNLPKDRQKIRDLTAFKRYLEQQIFSLKTDKKRFGIFYYFISFYQNKVILNTIRKTVLKLMRKTEPYYKKAVKYIKSRYLTKPLAKR